MVTTIKREGPLYLQVARALRDEIISGIFPVGAQLATEDMLCARFSVSRFTVREALRKLREEGLVASRKGAGTTVISPQSADTYVHQVMSINDLIAFAVRSRLAIASIKMMPIEGKLAERLGIESGTEWLAVQGVREAEDGAPPLSWVEYYIHRDFAGVGRLLPRLSGPIFSLIEDLYGQLITEVTQDIAGATVSSVQAAALKVKDGSAAIEVRRHYKTAEGKVAQATINIHPAARFRHSMTMRRVRA